MVSYLCLLRFFAFEIPGPMLQCGPVPFASPAALLTVGPLLALLLVIFLLFYHRTTWRGLQKNRWKNMGEVIGEELLSDNKKMKVPGRKTWRKSALGCTSSSLGGSVSLSSSASGLAFSSGSTCKDGWWYRKGWPPNWWSEDPLVIPQGLTPKLVKWRRLVIPQGLTPKLVKWRPFGDTARVDPQTGEVKTVGDTARVDPQTGEVKTVMLTARVGWNLQLILSDGKYSPKAKPHK